MKMKSCLDCKYEPDWSPIVGKEYPRRTGACKWGKKLPAIPKPFLFVRNAITRHADDSGVPENCAAWEAKP